jgi:hypothetical protein
MDFTAALEKKKEVGSTYSLKGIRYHVLVTPELEQDFINCLNHVPTHLLNDKHALQYSSTGGFILRGLWVDGGMRFHIDLTEYI